jgi:hypothetical protein
MVAAVILLALPWQDPAYETVALETGTRVDRVLAEDLNRDGRPDLVVQSGVDLRLFLFDKGFAPRATHSIRLDPGVFLWAFGKLDGQKFPALFTQGSRGVQVRAFDGRVLGPAADAVVHPTLFEGTCSDAGAPLHTGFAPDLDGDGRSEALLFRNDEIFLMKQHPGGEFRCLQKLPIPVESAFVVPWAAHQKLVETASVPLLGLGDMDGDGRTDLTYYRDQAIGVFRQEAGGSFSPLDSMELTEDRRKRRSRRYLQFEVPPWLSDFNGDGVLDLALVYPSRGRVHIYYGRAGRQDFTQPDEIMNVADGWSTGVHLEDLQGRGKADLVMGVVRKLGVLEGLQVFMSGQVNLELHLYPMQATGRFPKDPVRELKFTIPFSFHVTRDSMNLDLVFKPNFKGDFNRDGLRDMLVSVDERTLKIYYGTKERCISDQPGGTILMSPPAGVASTEPFVADFNGDGVSDLVLKHVLGPQKHALELKLSR